MNRYAGRRLAIGAATMSMPMQGKHRPIAIDNFSQACRPKVGPYLRQPPLQGISHGRVVGYGDNLTRVERREGLLQLHCCIDPSLDKCFDFFFSKSSQNAAPKSADEAF